MLTKNILVTGANGQLGSEIKALQNNYPNYQFFFVDKNELNIVDAAAIDNYFGKNKITHCINCAAYTAVDKAETQWVQSFSVNGVAVGTLAAACKKHHALLIHISTDYVFNGNGKAPYKETDATDPVNLYGQSKLKGEELAVQNNPDTIIIRTSWLYSSFGNNFVKTMLRLMREKESISVVDDQLGTPTYATDLADAILKIIEVNKPRSGIYHYSNSGIINWFQFAVAIKEISGSACEVKPIPTLAYPTPAKRPAYSAFDTKKIHSQLGVEILGWRESLEKCLTLLNEPLRN
ncbi:MAG: dTDP-4-dehydrorhamnose reductase [Ferruginibacter sp.]